MRRSLRSIVTAGFALGLLVAPATAVAAVATTSAPHAAHGALVIAQIHGGGGNQGGAYAHDFVVLFNRGPAAVSADGLSLQYTSADGTNALGATVSTRTALHGTVPAGGSLLIKGGQGETTGLSPLGHVDVDPGSNGINLHQNHGRVALVTGTTSLGCNTEASCSADQRGRIVDLVGYGTRAAFFEGAAAAPGLTNPSAAHRAGGGCTDTDQNHLDLAVGAPAPRSSVDPLAPCVVAPAPVVATPGTATEEPTVGAPAGDTASAEPDTDAPALPAEPEVPAVPAEEVAPIVETAPIETAAVEVATPVAVVPSPQPAPVERCTTPILQPVNCDGSSVFKLGSTVPVKFELPHEGDATFAAVRVSNRILGDAVEDTPVTLTPTNGAAYRYAGGAYHLNWSTRGLQAGTYRVTITTATETHTVRISLRS